MYLWSVQTKVNGFMLRSSFSEKPIFSNSTTNSSISFEIRVSNNQSLSKFSRYGSVSLRAIGKNNSGNSNNNSGNGDHYKDGEDGVKGNNPSRSNKSGNNGSQDSKRKPLDWREFRSLLYTQEMAEYENSAHNQEKTTAGSKNTPLKWAHPISEPENGCLLIATEKLDGVRTFERTVILLLRSGTRNPQEGPFGVVINRPLNKNMKHMNPTNIDLATTFADCSMHFGGPLDASMFLVRAADVSGVSGFQEVINGVSFGSRNSLDEASVLVKKGLLSAQDFRFFIGYAGWQLDQLRDEIESGYWHVAACSANLIFGGSQNYSSNGLWGDILQLMGGEYSELSRYPKQDV